MSAALARSRDRAVAAMRLSAAAVMVFGFTGTGALAGLLARQHAETAPTSEAGDANGDAQAVKQGGKKKAAATSVQSASRTVRLPASSQPRRVLVVVHEPAAGDAAPAAPAAPAPQASVSAAPAPAPAPVVAPPPEPVEPSGSSSGSDPG